MRFSSVELIDRSAKSSANQEIESRGNLRRGWMVLGVDKAEWNKDQRERRTITIATE